MPPVRSQPLAVTFVSNPIDGNSIRVEACLTSIEDTDKLINTLEMLKSLLKSNEETKR